MLLSQKIPTPVNARTRMGIIDVRGKAKVHFASKDCSRQYICYKIDWVVLVMPSLALDTKPCIGFLAWWKVRLLLNGDLD
jgi:hypothetical protein